MIIIFSVDDDVLDVLVANHSYTTFPDVFVDKHSNHTCVYGLHLLWICLFIFFTEVT